MSGGNSPLTNGFQVFAPFSGTTSVNGTAGNNRVGKNACIFEAAGTAGREPDSTLGFAKPEDRSDGITTNGQGDFDDDGDTLIDEFVTANGPIRNFDITQVNGPDLRFATLEDIYGDAGNSFQGSLGFLGPGRLTSEPARRLITVSAWTTWSSSGASTRWPRTAPAVPACARR